MGVGGYGRKERGLGLKGGEIVSGMRADTWMYGGCFVASSLGIYVPISSFFGRVAFTRVHEQRMCRRDNKAKTNRAITLMSRGTRSTSAYTPSASVEAMPNIH